MNAAVAHGPQNLSVSIINTVFYSIWRDTLYGDLRGAVRLKAQIHDSILYAYKHDDSPAKVAERMKYPVEVRDPHKITRTLLIPSDTNAGETSWGALK
jgi:regulator of RNase E activity RraA